MIQYYSILCSPLLYYIMLYNTQTPSLRSLRGRAPLAGGCSRAPWILSRLEP